MYAFALLLAAGSLQNAQSAPAPLLPEGSIVAQAQARVVTPKSGTGMQLRLLGPDAPADGRVREFAVLPSRLLEDLERFHAAYPGKTVIVTGALTLYDGRNWLLPVLIEHDSPAATRDVPDVVPVLQDPNDPSHTDAGDDESVADIVADLEGAVSHLRHGIRNSADASALDEAVADDLIIVSRRGRVHRTNGGTWVLLLDADNGRTDAPLVLLPSHVLGEIVQFTRRRGPGAPLLVSGTLQHYKGRRYLLPSGWRVPRERPNLHR